GTNPREYDGTMLVPRRTTCKKAQLVVKRPLKRTVAQPGAANTRISRSKAIGDYNSNQSVSQSDHLSVIKSIKPNNTKSGETFLSMSYHLLKELSTKNQIVDFV
ncbi:hypothetical protein CHS0354_042555, partial [Potamilus streckersoni]